MHCNYSRKLVKKNKFPEILPELNPAIPLVAFYTIYSRLKSTEMLAIQGKNVGLARPFYFQFRLLSYKYDDSLSQKISLTERTWTCFSRQ